MPVKQWICLILCLLLPVLASAETDYRGDGQYMLTVLRDTDCIQAPGGKEMAALAAQSRVIATGSVEVIGSETWQEIYLPGEGYGYVRSAFVLPEEPQLVAYHPGFGVSVGMFTVADPEQVRTEIISLDGLEYPVVELQRIEATRQEDGSYLLIAQFDTAGDVCKTTKEQLCATLYDLAGNPLEVLTMVFDAPVWRR